MTTVSNIRIPYSNVLLPYSWATVEDFIDLGLTLSHIETNLQLSSDVQYRSALQPCHADGCFEVLKTHLI